MGEAEVDFIGYGKILARTVLTGILALFVWLVVTVHNLSIDIAVLKNDVKQIHKYWNQEK